MRPTKSFVLRAMTLQNMLQKFRLSCISIHQLLWRSFANAQDDRGCIIAGMYDFRRLQGTCCGFPGNLRQVSAKSHKICTPHISTALKITIFAA